MNYTIEKEVAGIVQKKLNAMHNVVQNKHSWNDLVYFPIQAGGIGKSFHHQSLGRVFRAKATPYSKTYMPKKLTKLQKIKQKAYQEGVNSQTPTTKYWMDMYNEMLKQRQDVEDQLTIANAKVSSLSAILQSIHTSAQAGADILRVK